MPHRSEASRAATVWVVDLALSHARLERCARLLDAGERARADRFLREADRARFTASHAALRLILGEALDRDPASLRFEAGASGKPLLPGPEALDFNLSHSGTHGLVGLARGAAIGVDVEEVRPLPDALRIARAHFAPDEAACLAGMAPETVEAAFFGLWTRKEAVAKALGSGLSMRLDCFSVSLPPSPPRLLRMAGVGEGGWTMAAVDVGPGAAATVALRAPGVAIDVRRLPPDWPDGPA